jgi:hypothetical protein
MSDRMSSVEIEDVLSSIRRLVTEDLRPKPPVVAEKLLLTPALRVVPQAVSTDADPLDMPGQDAALSQGSAPVESAAAESFVFFHHRSAVSDRAEALSSIGAAVPADDYEPETGEFGPADAVPVPDWPDQSWVAPDVITDVAEAEVVALSDVAEEAPGWAQDTAHDGAAEAVDTDPDPTPYADPIHDEGLDAGGLDPHEAPYADADAGGDATEHADTNPDVAGLDDAGQSDPVIDEQGDAAEAAALAALAAADDIADDPVLTELDEDMLRDIVRDMIREELQGALGERITRNVRKLVRAEINRAMATRDLE